MEFVQHFFRWAKGISTDINFFQNNFRKIFIFALKSIHFRVHFRGDRLFLIRLIQFKSNSPISYFAEKKFSFISKYRFHNALLYISYRNTNSKNTISKNCISKVSFDGNSKKLVVFNLIFCSLALHQSYVFIFQRINHNCLIALT